MCRQRRSYGRAPAPILDSEGDSERSCGEQRLLPRIMARADLGRRRSESEPRDSDGVLTVERSRCAPDVLAHDADHTDRHVVAVVGAGHTRRPRSILVVAPGGGGLLGVTPDLAEQGSARPHRKCQHDRKESCLEHVDAHPADGKAQAKLRKAVK